MRRWIIWITILLVLAAGGFCIYWFLFRDTSDGGDLTNKEVLFAIQSILEDQELDLNTVVENHKKVSFVANHEPNSVDADGKVLPVAQNFQSLLQETSAERKSLSKEDFENFYKKPLIFAYSALYANVFGREWLRQNTWSSQTFTQKVDEKKSIQKTYKIKISSVGKNIYIWFYDEQTSTFEEMSITFNFRDKTNIYSLKNKITKTNKNALLSGDEPKDSYAYEYAYFNRDESKILNSDSISFTSEQRITEKQENYSLLDMNISSLYFTSDGKNKEYTNLESITDWETKKFEVQRYLLEKLDVNFKEQDSYNDAKTSTLKSLNYAYNYYNK